MLKKYRYHLYLLSAGFFYSTLDLFAVILSKSFVPPFSQIFWRTIFSIVTGVVIFAKIFKVELSISKKELKYVYFNSIILTFAFTTFIIAIFLGTPLAKAIALINAYPLGVVMLSYLLFRELPKKRQVISLVIALASVALLFEIWTIRNVTEVARGEILALTNSVCFAAIIIYGRWTETKIKIHPLKKIAYSLIFLIPNLFILGVLLNLVGINILTPRIRFDFPLSTWLSLAGIGFFGTTLSFGMLYAGISKVKPTTASLLLLTELIWATIWGIILFNQPLSIWGIIGILGIIISVVLV